jgi:hypothetical protein
MRKRFVKNSFGKSFLLCASAANNSLWLNVADKVRKSKREYLDALLDSLLVPAI